jgi:hypothetical protein
MFARNLLPNSGATPRLSDSNKDLIQAVIEEQAQLRILMLICMQDISAMLQEEPRDHKDEAFTILAVQYRCGAVFHGRPS